MINQCFLPYRPASSPQLSHDDTHSRIEHYASRYETSWTLGRSFSKITFKRKKKEELEATSAVLKET